MSIIKKILYLLKTEGFVNTLIRVLRAIKSRISSMLLKKHVYLPGTDISKESINELKNELESILKSNDYDRIVIWRSYFGWSAPLFQRPEHIALQLSKQGCLVFYEVTIYSDPVETIYKQAENLYLVNFLNPVVNETFFGLVDKIQVPKYIQFYSTNYEMTINEALDYERRGYSLLYEYVDDIHPEISGSDNTPENILRKHEYVMSDASIPVVTTARLLYQDVLNLRGADHLILSTNGVDYSFYHEYDDDFNYEPEFMALINNGKYNLCYYGALAKWFDYELIRKVDSTNKYNIIFFGTKYDSSYDDSGIDSLPNVHFLGSKEYKVLKYYARCMDILTIPFLINSITQATSPLKLFEYMALQKPIITTAMGECLNYKSVLIADNHDDYLKKLEKCVELMHDDNYLALLDIEAKENDWSAKACSIVALLESIESETHKEIAVNVEK